MTDPKQRYEESLKTFAVPGNRWNGVLALTYWATASGISTEAVLDDAHGVGVHDRDGDIRRGMDSAKSKVTVFSPSPTRRNARTVRPTATAPNHVRKLIAAGHDTDTFDGLRRLSEAPICPGGDSLALRVQCERQLVALFGPTDLIHVFRPDMPTLGEPGKNLRPLEEWLEDHAHPHPDQTGEIIRPNPFSGQQGQTKEGRPSYTAQSCLKDYRHMVFEFDALPLADQCRFWAGFIRQSHLPLVSLVYSGSKSIHGVIRVDAPDLATWQSYRKRILALFASDPDSRCRLDPQALHPLTGTRLAGVRRASTGNLQELLWARTDWYDTSYHNKLNPPKRKG